MCCNTGRDVQQPLPMLATRNRHKIHPPSAQTIWMNMSWIRQLRIETLNAYIIHTFYVRRTTIFDEWSEIKWTKKKSYLYSHHCRFVVIVKFNFKFYFLFFVALRFFSILFPGALCSTLSVCLSDFPTVFCCCFVLFFIFASTISVLWVWHAVSVCACDEHKICLSPHVIIQAAVHRILRKLKGNAVAQTWCVRHDDRNENIRIFVWTCVICCETQISLANWCTVCECCRFECQCHATAATFSLRDWLDVNWNCWVSIYCRALVCCNANAIVDAVVFSTLIGIACTRHLCADAHSHK